MESMNLTFYSNLQTLISVLLMKKKKLSGTISTHN